MTSSRLPIGRTPFRNDFSAGAGIWTVGRPERVFERAVVIECVPERVRLVRCVPDPEEPAGDPVGARFFLQSDEGVDGGSGRWIGMTEGAELPHHDRLLL